MTEAPRKKVGLISCSGEDLPEGTVSRMATLKVLGELRSGDTVTLCLPLFLAGDEQERAFARVFPTIAIDGCEKRCAARATEKYSASPEVSLVITDIIAERNLPRPREVRQLDDAGKQVTSAVVQMLTREVDRLLGKESSSTSDDEIRGTAEDQVAEPGSTSAAPCSCGTSFPVAEVNINGRPIKVIALPAIFELFRKQNKLPVEDIVDELMVKVKLYNRVASAEENTWREAILREYESYIANSALKSGERG